MGFLAAVVLAIAVWWWMGSRAPSRIVRMASSRATDGAETTTARKPSGPSSSLVAQAPLIADLMSAVVSSGATVLDALSATTNVVEDPARSQLERVRSSIELGAPASSAWSELLDEDSLAPIASAAIRSLHTGAPLGLVLDAAAFDMRQAHRAHVTQVARSAGVRSVAPLALCFLPAYLLVGVVPIVAGFATSLFG